MKILISLLLTVSLVTDSLSQDRLVNAGLHEHITFKNYVPAINDPSEFNKKIKAMGGIHRILASRTLFDQAFALLNAGHATNWEPVLNDKSKKKLALAIADWDASHWDNYSQAEYTNLSLGNFKYVVTSITPLEKPNMQNPISFHFNKKQTKIDKDRLRRYSDTRIPHFEEFLAEYYYTLLTAAHSRKKNNTGFVVIDNRGDFDAVSQDSASVGVLISIEGAHVLHGSYYYNNGHYKCPPLKRYLTATDDEWRQALQISSVSKKDKSIKKNIEKVNLLVNQKIQSDLLAYVDTLRSLTPRVHFITGAHFAFNDMFGQDKALDKESERWILQIAAVIGWSYKLFFNKPYAGITPAAFMHGENGINNQGSDNDAKLRKRQVGKVNMGLAVLDSLHDIANINTPHWKPIFFDMKHSDELTFLEYVAYRQMVFDKYQRWLPLIVSHVAANGEGFKVSFFTSQKPLYDRYKELTKNDKFYYNKTRYRFPPEKASVLNRYNHLLDTLAKLNDSAYYAYSGAMKTIINEICGSDYRPKIVENDLPKAGKGLSASLGWFNPWSTNLADEQIKFICDHNGIIGIMLEDRVLGRTTIRYKKKSIRERGTSKSKMKNDYHDDAIVAKVKQWNRTSDSEINGEILLSIAPFLRNLLYMAEKGAGGTPNAARLDGKVWDHFCIGSDFDGYVNPIDICPRHQNIPKLKTLLVQYFDAFVTAYDILEYQQNKGQSPSANFQHRWGLSFEAVVAKVFETNLPKYIKQNILVN